MIVLVEKIESYNKSEKFIEQVFDVFDPKVRYLKPNFLKYDNPSNACITHPSLVVSILRVAEEYGIEFTVVEGGFYKKSAEKCFVEFGLREKAECINLNTDKFVEIESNGKALKTVKVAKTAIKARNSYLTVPKMKVHHLTKVTLGIKNNMGFLKKPAVYMHPNIHQKLVDLLNLFYPSLVIVDGVIGGNYSEMHSKPVKHGVLIASNNVVAADIVAAKLMGFSPQDVKHIRIAMEKFDISEKDIEIKSSGIEGLKKEYRLSFSSKLLGRIGI